MNAAGFNLEVNHMKYLFFDTETTGLPVNYNAPANDLVNWPRIVQLAWAIYDNSESRLIARCNYIVKPMGFTIPPNMVHGISNDYAKKTGYKLKNIMNLFYDDLIDADYIVAHNLDFDLPICGAEFIRTLGEDMIGWRPGFCTQKQTTNWARIPAKSGQGYKWPSLAELHRACGFGEIKNAHDAASDVEACAKCFFYIKSNSPNTFNLLYNPK